MNSRKATIVLLIVTLFVVIALLLGLLIYGFYMINGTQSKKVSTEPTDRSDSNPVRGSSVIYIAESRDGTPVTESGMERTLEIMRKRLDNMGYTNALVSLSEGNKLTIEFPDKKDPTKVANELAQTASLEFRINGQDTPCLAGDDVDSAISGFIGDVSSGEIVYIVSLTFNDEGAKKFAEVTKYCAANNRTLDIYVDGVVISSPNVDSKYASTGITGGEAQISGSFTAESATTLANMLDAGTLPYTLTVDKILSNSIK